MTNARWFVPQPCGCGCVGPPPSESSSSSEEYIRCGYCPAPYFDHQQRWFKSAPGLRVTISLPPVIEFTRIWSTGFSFNKTVYTITGQDALNGTHIFPLLYDNPSCSLNFVDPDTLTPPNLSIVNGINIQATTQNLNITTCALGTPSVTNSQVTMLCNLVNKVVIDPLRGSVNVNAFQFSIQSNNFFSIRGIQSFECHNDYDPTASTYTAVQLTNALLVTSPTQYDYPHQDGTIWMAHIGSLDMCDYPEHSVSTLIPIGSVVAELIEL